MRNLEKYIDESIARSALAERCEIPAVNWRYVLYKAKAAITAERVINLFRDGKLNTTYGELFELVERALDEQDVMDEIESEIKNDQ